MYAAQMHTYVHVCTSSWTIYTSTVYRCGVRERMTERRASELAGQRSRFTELGKRWSKVQTGRRVIIHLPSLGNGVLYL